MYVFAIYIKEFAGIDRVNEPVSRGIPIPRGMLYSRLQVRLEEKEGKPLPVQAAVLALWDDRSIKWLLLDFQVSIDKNSEKTVVLKIVNTKEDTGQSVSGITVQNTDDVLMVHTGKAVFHLGKALCCPFEAVEIRNRNVIDKSMFHLTSEDGNSYLPYIDKISLETEGPIRTAVKLEGRFTSNQHSLLSFCARLHFFADRSLVKIEFSILNPERAVHPNGLWDLGDANAVVINDLSFQVKLEQGGEDTIISYQTNANESWKQAESDIVLYQDSSGGKNWNSPNHVNRSDEVKNVFRGYEILENGKQVARGLRAEPVLSIRGSCYHISCVLRHFWQQFPKSLEGATDATLALRLFPKQFGDSFEIQPGEQKTHTLFVNFGDNSQPEKQMKWIHYPLSVIPDVDAVVQSGAISSVIPLHRISDDQFLEITKSGVEGPRSFREKNEIIDEFGWRHFGELYADHEAVFNKDAAPLISHYNNQYDCIFGMLCMFLSSGDNRWFELADELCSHVKDIDVYHTDADRLEYNHGLFWHTGHYTDAKTATHRAFSIQNTGSDSHDAYGGGPSLSHVYTSGILYHYLLTGSMSSFDCFFELVHFVENKISMVNTAGFQLVSMLKQTRNAVNKAKGKNHLVNLDKVYDLNGPGRASGNALSVLVDAYTLSGKKRYLLLSEQLIRKCISPDDDIEKRNLGDIENRWMYTVFLQALGKYTEVKKKNRMYDAMLTYAEESLRAYADWICRNEGLYLESPEKLEFPNETWAVQDLRKAAVLMYGVQSTQTDNTRMTYTKKAESIYKGAMKLLSGFETRYFTRPVALLMQNGLLYHYLKITSDDAVMESSRYNRDSEVPSILAKASEFVSRFSLKNEIQYMKWKIKK